MRRLGEKRTIHPTRRQLSTQGSEEAKAKTVNHMSIAYAEIDGEPARLLPEGDLKPQITRTVFYTEEPAAGQ